MVASFLGVVVFEIYHIILVCCSGTDCARIERPNGITELYPHGNTFWLLSLD